MQEIQGDFVVLSVDALTQQLRLLPAINNLGLSVKLWTLGQLYSTSIVNERFSIRQIKAAILHYKKFYVDQND